jgi:hypothetical protein
MYQASGWSKGAFIPNNLESWAVVRENHRAPNLAVVRRGFGYDGIAEVV